MYYDPKKIQPYKNRFRLVKFFAYTSFIILIISSFILSTVISQRATKILMNAYEDHALLIAKNLNHQVFHYFNIPIRYRYGSISLREREQFDLMDRIVRTTIHSFNVETVNIYDVNKGVIAYSTDKDMIGLTGRGGVGYKAALKGKLSSGLLSGEPSIFQSWFIDFAKEKKLRTFIPFDAEPPFTYIGILGVFELTQDLTKEYESVSKFRYLIFGVSLGIMILIFLALLLVVRKAEITLRKRAEEQKLLEDQLNQSERLAVLGEMVAGVSHEIKNPLGIIRSTAELLTEKLESNPIQKKLSSIIIDESCRLNDIVTDFLDFARPEVPILQDSHLEDIFYRIFTFLQPELNKKGIILNKEYLDNRQFIIKSDPGLLYRAFLNIFINAIQSINNGGKINIAIKEENKNYQINIQDTGTGISKNNIKKIFNPFFTTKDKGSGLGLPIVKKIIEGHNGTIWIKSEIGEGTSVFVSLPVKS